MDAQRIAVLAGMYCEHLIVVDLTTGEQVVTIALESARLLPSYGRPAILGDTVVVGSAGGGAGFRISDGEQLWWSPLDAECVETSFTVANGAFVSRLACGYDCNGRRNVSTAGKAPGCGPPPRTDASSGGGSSTTRPRGHAWTSWECSPWTRW